MTCLAANLRGQVCVCSICQVCAEDSGGNIFGGGLRQNFSFRPLFPTSTNFIREKTGTAAGSQKFADLF